MIEEISDVLEETISKREALRIQRQFRPQPSGPPQPDHFTRWVEELHTELDSLDTDEDSLIITLRDIASYHSLFPDLDVWLRTSHLYSDLYNKDLNASIRAEGSGSGLSWLVTSLGSTRQITTLMKSLTGDDGWEFDD